jgi:hypothetical protein
MPSQSTDAINDAPLVGSKVVEDDVKFISQRSAQDIARDRKNLGGLDASGNEAPVTAKVQAGK